MAMDGQSWVRECPSCGQTKPHSMYHRNGRRADGLAYYCKECVAVRAKEKYRTRKAAAGKTVRVPEQLPRGVRRCADCRAVKPVEDFSRNRSASSGYHSYCKPCGNARSAESRQRLHGGSRHYHLKRRYGLGADEVDAMIKAQFGICPICLKPRPEHVDHDHSSGEVRGVLCFNCNSGLGQFKDRPDLLRRAAAYLEGIVWNPTRVAPGVYRVPS
ncbi:MAG: recombinase [Streptomycetaceae bacterium]|nr:recombinase [Streptomycetaceae bacterium]